MSTHPFEVEVLDSDLVDATQQDRITVKVFSPDTALLYQASGLAGRGHAVRIG